MAETLPPQYDPAATEAELYRWWEEHGFFRADAAGEAEPYTIVIPPPNVTASLHMGHGLNNTIQDVLIRWRRMQGRETLWQPGTDHAGIATQNVVERKLAESGKTRFDVGREAFVEEVWDYVRATGSTILRQLQAIGCSCDWERTRFTLDEGLSRAVREVFVRLHERGLIYRGNYIINWCPRCLTALSDEEAEPTETTVKLYHLRYPVTGASTGSLPVLPDGRAYVVVATTRPETMLGDVAVAVHPFDERFAGVLDARIELPFTGRTIPFVADEYVDPEFGSGAVKITPAHDPNDFELARRHDLPALNVMTPDARIEESMPEAFRGLDRYEARDRIVAAFAEAGLLDRVVDHLASIPHCYRCNTVVEPRLSLQWFVKMKPLAEPALAASREGRVRFTPERYTKVYENWLEGIRDWCISRQLWWGHRIPAWHCRTPGCGEIIVARETPVTCPHCGGSELEQDPDVLDTWFSSWLWPFSTLGWPEKTPELDKFYPGNTLVTGPDIIFFWVARMIMAGIEFMGEVPFRDVYLNGIVRDHLGRKQSKSLGNGIDPLKVVDLYGADALRYTVIAGAGAGTDQYMNYENLEETFGPGRNFANKLWNAGRFALMNLGDGPVQAVDELSDALEPVDRWILSRLSRTTVTVTEALERFRLNDAAAACHAFFWGEVADWYLEMVKPRLRGDAGERSRDAARATLVTVLDGSMRLLHPVMPFITEAVWSRLPAKEGRAPSLMVAEWPCARPEWEDATVELLIDNLRAVIGAVRNTRAEYGVQPAQRVTLRVSGESEDFGRLLRSSARTLSDLARVDTLESGGANGEIGVTTVLDGGVELFVPLAGVVDLERERQRLRTELERVATQADATEKRLSNESFVGRAPADVVAREREKLANFSEQREKLSRTLATL
ncbi:MAG: valine--tRNA ligase, partial [Gemmatimonadota bacterium]|nr:valine--tRNA ligase [Gemmatimonadota bacterium]